MACCRCWNFGQVIGLQNGVAHYRELLVIRFPIRIRAGMRAGKSSILLEGAVRGRKLIMASIWFSSDVNSLAMMALMAMSSSFFFPLFCFFFQTENKQKDKSEYLGKRLAARKFFRGFQNCIIGVLWVFVTSKFAGELVCW